MKSELKKKRKLSNKFKIMENNWDERFILEKIPQYDAYKDINYLSLGLVKSKIRYEEKQLKESQKKQKKLRTNSSRLTLNTKPKKNIYSPLLTSLKENEKNELISVKNNKRPLTIRRKKIKANKTIEFNNLKIKKDNKNDKDYYVKTCENKNTNKSIYNNNHDNNNNIDNDKETIIIDNDLEKELNEVKELWDNLGVTPEYQIFFGEMLDRLKTRDMVQKYLSFEKKQLIQFKSDLEKLMNDIYKRENDLNNLKKIDEIYSKNEQLNKYNILKNKKEKIHNQKNKIKNKKGILLTENEDEILMIKNRNINGNEYDLDNVEKSKEFDEELMKYKVNKEKIENDISNCLKLLRLHTINTVIQFTKFRINNNFYFTSGKNDVNQMKNGYEFDYNYLLKIKKDCEFFKKSSIKEIYNFSQNCENDPFFLNLLQKDNNRNNNTNNTNNTNEHKYKYLTATEDTINNINQCMFILDQEDMYFKISQNLNQNQNNGGTNNNNNTNNDNDENEDTNNNSYTKNNKNQIGTNFQGNLENEISKLRSQNEYQKLFFNSAEIKDPLFTDTNMDNNMNMNIKKYEQGPKKIPETTSKELIQSFDYYDKIKTDIFNKEEIQNIQNNVHKPTSNKIIIFSKSNNQNKEIKKNNTLNLNFNKINKKIKNENNNNSVKISINSANRNKGQNKKSYEINVKINNKNDDKREEENKNIDNTNNNKMNANIMKNDSIICDDNKEENSEKTINCKYISMVSLIDKKDSSDNNNNNTTNFNIGSILFKIMNTLNLNLLLNSLKNNNKYSINSQNNIISKSIKEINDSYKYIKNQNNNITKITNLQSLINENILFLSDDNVPPSKTYAFLSSLMNINFNSLKILPSIIYNNYKYNGIKIKTSKHILSIEDDLVLYTIPTEDKNIFIYICLYNEKVKEIIKKYDKSNNIFNGFSSFVNIISLYFDDDNNDNNKDESEKIIWIPCFEIESQLICNKIPGYKKINIKDNNNNKDMDIFEYDEIIKINMKPNICNENESENIYNINKDEDIIIENDFLFGLFHKEIKNKFNTPFISLTFIGKENFIIAN